MTSEAKNLAAICAALDGHADRCGSPATAIRLNPFEVERLGWDEVRGVPVEADDRLATGRIRIACDAESDDGALAADVARAFEVPRELVTAGGVETYAESVRRRYRGD